MKRHFIKAFILVGLFFLFTPITAAQWSFLGLSDRKIEGILSYGNNIYVATDVGVYRKSISSSDTVWSSIGLKTRQIKTLLVLGDSIFIAGVKITGFNDDTISLFKTTNAGISWDSYQNGFGDGESTNQVWAMDGNDVDQNIIYASGKSMVIAKSNNGGLSWQKSYGDWHLGAMGTHFVKINETRNNIIWAGGETGFLQPFILKSTTSGETWEENYLSVGGDNACYSVVCDVFDSNLVYVGMEGRVIKTTNGGKNWFTILQPSSYPYFYGLSLVKDSILYATGAINTGEPQRIIFYKSINAGTSWDTIIYADKMKKGINCILSLDQDKFTKLFFGTFDDGVYLYTDEITNIDKSLNQSILYVFSLRQNYPNPFNPSTTIEYSVANSSNVKILIYNILGQKVATVVNEMKDAGVHTATFNAQSLASGIYFYEMRTGSYVSVKKMLLMK